MSLGDRIRDLRKQRGLNLSELADSAKISVSYLSQIERGEKESVSADILFRLAKTLGTTMNALLSEQTSPVLPTEAEPIDIPEPLRRFYESRREALNMTEDDLRMLASIRYRNQQPRKESDWEFLFLSIKRTVDP